MKYCEFIKYADEVMNCQKYLRNDNFKFLLLRFSPNVILGGKHKLLQLFRQSIRHLDEKHTHINETNELILITSRNIYLEIPRVFKKLLIRLCWRH